MMAEELEKYSQYVDRDWLKYIDQQQQLFDEARPGHLHEYVAFEDGQVLDHDVDQIRLAERVYRKYGCRDLIMQRGTPKTKVFHQH